MVLFLVSSKIANKSYFNITNLISGFGTEVKVMTTRTDRIQRHNTILSIISSLLRKYRSVNDEVLQRFAGGVSGRLE